LFNEIKELHQQVSAVTDLATLRCARSGAVEFFLGRAQGGIDG
jgi:hypothetical protein